MEKKQKRSLWKKWWFWVGLFFGIPFLFLLILGTIGNNLPQDSTTVPSKAAQAVVTQAVVTQPVATPKYVFDVPALMSKDIDGVKAVLGKSKGLEPNSEQVRLGVKEWDATFEKEGKELLVTYNIGTKQIKDFFISSDDPSGKTSNKNHLLELGNLKENDPTYKIEFVKALREPSSFTGIKVSPR